MKVVACWATLLFVGCHRAEPAHVVHPAAEVAKEGNLLVLHLTPSAEQRLGIETAEVVRRAVPRLRTLAGDVRVPPGRSVLLTAPWSGTLVGTPPVVGQRLAAGETILTLVPVLTAEARASFAAMRVDADGACAGADVQLAAGEVALERARRLLDDGVGSRRAVDEAQAQRDTAAAGQRSARARRDLLDQAIAGTLGAVPVLAPFAGMLRQLVVAPGQSVAAGSMLAEVADLDDLWVRVPVYVGDLAGLDTTRAVRIGGLSAEPVQAPPAGDPAAATVDVWYAVHDPEHALRPGQRVFVPVPSVADEAALVLPWSALQHDMHGGDWVYERTGEQQFVRRRVQVRFVDGDAAAIDAGLAPGARVVTAGVSELSGIEFGHAR